MGGWVIWRSIRRRFPAVPGFGPMAFLGALLALCLSACGPLVRPYYNRDIGGYLMPNSSMTPTALVQIQARQPISARW